MGWLGKLFGFGNDDDDENDFEEIDTSVDTTGAWGESDIPNDESSEEGAPHTLEGDYTGDGKDWEQIAPTYAEEQETLEQPKTKGGLFDWLFGN
jgi:hypothetical protein